MQNTEPARIRLISAGVKVFGKSDLSRKGSDGGDSDVEVEGKLTQYASKQRDGHGIQFRITNEGLHSVLPYFNRERLLKGDAASLRMFLQKYYPLCVDFEEPFRSVMESTRKLN
jgi:multisite-specific tRNA:(cytosine-C5)-methyltransferase